MVFSLKERLLSRHLQHRTLSFIKQMFAGKKQRGAADDDYEKRRLDLFRADLDRDCGWGVVGGWYDLE